MAKFCNTYDLKKDIGVMAAVMSGAFLLGALICFVVVKVFGANDPDITSAQTASVFAVAGGGIFLLIFGTLALKSRFEMAVCMSQARKNFIRRESVETIIVTAAAFLFGILLYKIDDFMQHTIYRGLTVELDVKFFFRDFLSNPVNFATVIVGIVGVRFLFGVMYMKWGQKFLWGIWAVWMFLSLFAPRLARTHLKDITDAAKFLSDTAGLLGGYFFQIMICIAAAVLFATACLMLGRQEAKGY